MWSWSNHYWWPYDLSTLHTFNFQQLLSKFICIYPCFQIHKFLNSPCVHRSKISKFWLINDYIKTYFVSYDNSFFEIITLIGNERLDMNYLCIWNIYFESCSDNLSIVIFVYNRTRREYVWWCGDFMVGAYLFALISEGKLAHLSIASKFLGELEKNRGQEWGQKDQTNT